MCLNPYHSWPWWVRVGGTGVKPMSYLQRIFMYIVWKMMIYLQLLHFFNDKNLHRLKDRLAKFTQAKTIKGRDDIRKSLHHCLVGCWESAHGKYCYTLVLYYYTLTLSSQVGQSLRKRILVLMILYSVPALFCLQNQNRSIVYINKKPFWYY